MINNQNDTPDFSGVSNLIEWIQSRRRFSKKNSLDNMLKYCELLGNPQKNLFGIHVTGTNGKGSSVAMLRSIFMKSGKRVGTFTSPFIVKFNERIEIDGEFISDEDLIKYSKKVYSIYDELTRQNIEHPSFFEFITLIAFCYFNDNNIDICIFEVGIGGRLDSTNVFKGFVNIITNVTYDHMDVLGNTLESICKEKLGIVKEQTCLISSSRNTELLKQMEIHCKNINSEFIKPDFESLKIENVGISSSIFSYKGLKYELSLVGFHQIDNALGVIETINYFNENKKSNFNISYELLYEGLKDTNWPGRLECVSSKPLIMIDGGHNIDCITRICEFVKQLPYKYKRAIIAISNDKDKLSMVKLLDSVFDELVFTHYTYSRSAKADDLYSLSNNSNKKIIDSIENSARYCYDNPVEFTVFIGSLYLVSEIRPFLKK